MYNLELLPENLRSGAKEICKMLKIQLSCDGKPIVAKTGDMSIEETTDNVYITYHTKSQFFRMLSMLTGDVAGKYSENPRQSMLCYMADQSRNAVMTIDSAKQMIRYLAALGFDSLMLYTEDTFEVDNQPYFGYMRGRWTQTELCELVNYGEQFGIELIPCIQTLAHVMRILRWPCYSEIHDCNDILLAGDEKTYAFLDDIFKTCAKCFKSRKINIGLDEAHMLGLGKYLDKNGFHNRSDIMLSHLSRVCEIADKYGFHPMMWSDMFFRLAFGTYYIKEGEITADVISRVPENLTLIYWDYYTSDVDKFSHMVKCHKAFNNPTAFAGGCHKWGGFVANNMVTYNLESMHIDKCLDAGLDQIIATGWGDDGAEAAHYSIIPGLLLYAEKCYKGDFDREWFDKRFEKLFKLPMKPFEIMDEIDCPPGLKRLDIGKRSYFHKALIYSDVLEGLYNKHLLRDECFEFYSDMAQKLEKYTHYEGFGYLVQTAYAAARLCIFKSTLPIDIRAAYEAHDIAELENIARIVLPQAVEAAGDLLDTVENQWNIESRAFGLEVQQARLGGLKERLGRIAQVILKYCDGKIDKIDELEQEVLYIDCRTEPGDDLTPSRVSAAWHSAVSVNIV